MAGSASASAIDLRERVLTITRFFAAPRVLVWRAWTDPAHVARWKGPRGFIAHAIKQDLRPGGAWRTCLRAHDGRELWQSGVYREVVEPERLVFTYAWEQEGGSRGHETLVTVVLSEQNGTTRMDFRQEVFESEEQCRSHRDGWNSTFDRLEEHLLQPADSQNEPTITITRIFAAPRASVFPAWTDPRQLAQWWGPRGFRAPVCELDVRPSGVLRVTMCGPEGSDYDREYPCRGEYHEIVPNERLVYSMNPVRAAWPDSPPPPDAVHEVAFEDYGDKTKVTITARLVSLADRDTMVTMGFREGFGSSLDRLVEILPKL